MTDFFLYRPHFRMLMPILMGSLAYVLLLLVNNNVEQLSEEFLSSELYFCWAMALLMQESSRLVLKRDWKPRGQQPFRQQLIRRVITAFLIGIILTAIGIGVYFQYILGYRPDRLEFLMVLSTFGFLALVQMLLFGSQQYVHFSNEEQLIEELQLKESVQADFHQFKRGINPQLLFESLEATIVCLYKDGDQADEILDQLATIYRYVLGKRRTELVSAEEELYMSEELIALFNFLPYRGTQIQYEEAPDGAVVPGTFLQVIEHIIRTRIAIPDQPLTIYLLASRDYYDFRFRAPAKLGHSLVDALVPLQDRYKIYTQLPWKIKREKDDNTTCIQIPRLYLDGER